MYSAGTSVILGVATCEAPYGSSMNIGLYLGRGGEIVADEGSAAFAPRSNIEVADFREGIAGAEPVETTDGRARGARLDMEVDLDREKDFLRGCDVFARTGCATVTTRSAGGSHRGASRSTGGRDLTDFLVFNAGDVLEELGIDDDPADERFASDTVANVDVDVDRSRVMKLRARLTRVLGEMGVLGLDFDSEVEVDGLVASSEALAVEGRLGWLPKMCDGNGMI